MWLFRSNASKYQEKRRDENLYGFVANEIANDHVSPGLWAKAFAESDDDEKNAQAKYITSRVNLLKLEEAATLDVVKRDYAHIAPTIGKDRQKSSPAASQDTIKTYSVWPLLIGIIGFASIATAYSWVGYWGVAAFLFAVGGTCFVYFRFGFLAVSALLLAVGTMAFTYLRFGYLGVTALVVVLSILVLVLTRYVVGKRKRSLEWRPMATPRNSRDVR